MSRQEENMAFKNRTGLSQWYTDVIRKADLVDVQ